MTYLKLEDIKNEGNSIPEIYRLTLQECFDVNDSTNELLEKFIKIYNLGFHRGAQYILDEYNL